MITVKARAKINIVLEVLHQRKDGYHNLRSVMQSLHFHDTLIINKAAKNEIIVSCENKQLPETENNLIYKAADYLIKKYNPAHGVSVALTKKIPISAGLGGGSSNCAAALQGINQLLNLNIPDDQLLKIGKELGADVPFCLISGTALAEGIGEKLTPLPPHPQTWVLMACPDVYFSTKEMFKKIKPKENINGNVLNIKNALQKKDIPGIAACFYNDFTDVAVGMYPQIKELINILKESGAVNASMSGSGPTVFGYFEKESDAENARRKVETLSFLRHVFLTETYNRKEN